jgi:hypothetical protein
MTHRSPERVKLAKILPDRTKGIETLKVISLGGCWSGFRLVARRVGGVRGEGGECGCDLGDAGANVVAAVPPLQLLVWPA